MADLVAFRPKSILFCAFCAHWGKEAVLQMYHLACCSLKPATVAKPLKPKDLIYLNF